jgi:hypothetical protein
MLVDNQIMPQPYRYELTDGVTTIEDRPTNYEDFELGLVRDGLTINREITAELRFANAARTFVENAYNLGRPLTLLFYVRQNDWTMLLSKTLTAEFETYTDDLTECGIRFMEGNVQKDLDKNGGIDYDFKVPYKKNGALDTDARILDYTGIYRDRTNRLSITNGNTYTVQTDQKNRVAPALHSTSVPSSAYHVSDEYAFIQSTGGTTATIQFKVGNVKIITNKNPIPILVLNRIRNGVTTRLFASKINGEPFEYEGFLKACMFYGTLVGTNLSFAYYLYSDTNEYEVSITDGQTDDIYIMGFESRNVSLLVVSAEDSYFRLVSEEPSTFVDYQIPVVSYEWILTKILEKISPTATLTYNLVNTTDVRMLASGSCLYQSESPVITANFEDVMKALKVEYGADYMINGNEVIIDYHSAMFPDVSGGTITPASKPRKSYDDTHVYNSVKVGWETGDGVVNGSLEYNCINTFVLQGNGEKELDLVHPFKGSPYTIEQFMLDKSTDSTESKTSDTDIFVFCCSEFVNQHATLERDGLTSNMPTMAYNAQITPMRLLIANGRYLGVSTYKSSPTVLFTSTDRKSDYQSKFTYESETIYENQSNGIIESRMTDRLFTPEMLEFDTSIGETEVTPAHLGAYKYFTLVGEKNEYSYDIRIKNITLHQTGAKSQQWQTWIK